jgi:hypothetical protein
MAANAPFTAVTKVGTVSNYSKEGLKTVMGTAVGPDVAGADTVLDLSAFFNGTVKSVRVQPISGTTWCSCQPVIGTGAPATIKVNIFTGTTDVAQSTADLKGITFSWVAIGTDYE